MRSNRMVIVLLLVLFAVPAMVFAGGGQEQQTQAPQQQEAAAQGLSPGEIEARWRDPNIPESWYEAPRTASELGITSFQQSPFLDARVTSGELPPVEERLPNDPPVIEPYASVGEYGGTMVMYGYDLESEFSFYAGGGVGREGLLNAPPDGTRYYPWFAESVELLDDFTGVEITLREGLRWSDGTPIVAATEYDFHWNHTIPATTIDPALYSPEIVDVEVVSDNTVRLHFGQPFPSYEMQLFHTWFHDILSENVALAPSHVMRQYLPEFVGEAEAQRKAEEFGFSEVEQLILELGTQVRVQEDPRFGMPTTEAYIVVSESESERVLERNPYYPFVDTEGNQLPYIDRVIIRFAAQPQNVELQAVAGASDVLFDSAQTGNIPTYIEGEEDGDYNTYINLSAALSRPFYIFNFTPPEESEEYGQYYRDDRFRKAMSLAINRNEINDRFYFGRGIPMQATISPTSDLFRPEWANAYAAFDPIRAGELLDEVGLVDRNGDGFRDFPNGDRFTVKMMYHQALYLSEIELHEYVITNWADVGIQVDIETVSGEVFWERSSGGQYDLKMHIMDFSIPYPLGVVFFTTPYDPPEVHPFGQYSTWLRTDGQDGIEPPDFLADELQMLYDATDEYLNTLSDAALSRILQSQAENIWVIGTVGLPPTPALVAKRIQNVPERILWEGTIGHELLMRPQQWWIDE